QRLPHRLRRLPILRDQFRALRFAHFDAVERGERVAYQAGGRRNVATRRVLEPRRDARRPRFGLALEIVLIRRKREAELHSRTKATTGSTWSGVSSIGAWPMPANSSTRGRGP